MAGACNLLHEQKINPITVCIIIAASVVLDAIASAAAEAAAVAAECSRGAAAARKYTK